LSGFGSGIGCGWRGGVGLGLFCGFVGIMCLLLQSDNSATAGKFQEAQMATDFLAICFQVGMFALTFGLMLAGYAWLVT
jgi:hypothetical protein